MKQAPDLHAVTRTMQILESLADSTQALTVSDLSARLGIEKSVVSRILSTLERSKYIHRDGFDAFVLGWNFCGLALRHFGLVDLDRLFSPILRKIADSTGELVQIAVADGEGLVYIAKADSAHTLRMLSLTGQRAPLHATTAGKVWLAGLPMADALAIVAKQGMEPFTQRTICDLDALREEILTVRDRGYAIVEDEFLPGANGFGVPIRDRVSPDLIVGALVVSGPSVRWTRQRMEAHRSEIIEVAEQLRDLRHLVR